MSCVSMSLREAKREKHAQKPKAMQRIEDHLYGTAEAHSFPTHLLKSPERDNEAKNEFFLVDVPTRL